MSRLSRPYQIALVAVLLLAVAWFVALRPDSSRSGASTSLSATVAHGRSVTDPRPTRRRSAAAPKNSSSTRSNAARGKQARTGAKVRPQTASASGASHAAGVGSGSETARASSGSHASSAASGWARRLPRGREIGRQLAEGKTVLLLFWNPRSAPDIAVHEQVAAVGAQLRSKVAIHYARANEVGTFGTVTRNISIYETPTLLIVEPDRVVTTMTGLTDAFSIEQAMREAKR